MKKMEVVAERGAQVLTFEFFNLLVLINNQAIL